jgi:ArsR family transcriptional regulator
MSNLNYGGVTLVRSTSDLIKENELEKMSETLKAVAHPVRLQIVNILMNGERSVGELVKTLGTKQSLTSQQLSILKSRGVLKSRRNGNVVFYSLENTGVKNIMASILAEIK